VSVNLHSTKVLAFGGRYAYIAIVAKLVTGKIKDLGGGFNVLRILPHLDARSIGPFVFVDHFGPVDIKTGEELAVRPHPHIGLATITYLYGGVVRHKDSLGNDLEIRPGEVNWMTAGRGIVHSEHSRLAPGDSTMEGIQTWVALPADKEETEAAFEHYAATDLPEISGPQWTLRLIAGTLMGQTSPVKTHSPLFYADLHATAAATVKLDFPAGQQAAIYISQGTFALGELRATVGSMIVLEPSELVQLATQGPARAILLGGEKFPETRHLWWNFVSSDRDRIERARTAWRANTMGTVAGESDRIPLPD
jgi:redox-sensitive bicupin YhaK (pirin superfamily)